MIDVRDFYIAEQAAGRLPKKALSIMQPWSWLIANGLKDIENRDWRTNYRGPVLVHAGQKVDQDAHISLTQGYHPVTLKKLPAETADAYLADVYSAANGDGSRQRGGIVGVVDIVGCYDGHDSQWFVGAYGFELANAKPLPFLPMKGALSFFDADVAKVVPEPGIQDYCRRIIETDDFGNTTVTLVPR